ncbi:hypothetical protein C3L33_19533, partial [Rhododendron williamsianum]
MLPKTQMPSIQTIISAAASAAAAAMVVRSVAKDLIPTRALPQPPVPGRRDLPRHRHTPDTKRFRASKPEKENQIKVSMEKDEELTDSSFGGFPIRWRFLCKKTAGSYIADPDDYYGGSFPKSEARFFELVFHKKTKDKVINEYLPYILEKSKILKEEQRTLKLWTLKNDRDMGGLKHPLFMEIEQLMEMKKVTPAEVGEQLLKNEEAESALRGLIEFLEEKKEIEEVKDGELEQKDSGSEGETEIET